MFALAICVLVVVVTSAMCSLFEAVLYSVPVGHIETLVASKSRAGRLLKKLRAEVDAPITAILSLNTIANTAGAAIAGWLAGQALGAHNVVYFSIFFTVAILLLSEVIPKTVGVVYSRPLAAFVALPILGLVTLFRPVIWVLRLITRYISGDPSSEIVSVEEIKVMVRLGHKTGSLDEDELGVIENIMSLGTKTAEDVLTPRTVLYAVQGDQTVGEVFRDKGSWTYSRLPVYFEDLDDVAGIVFRRDILTAAGHDRDDVAIKDIMRPVHFVLMTMRLNKVLAMFLERGEHMFAVIDEFGGLEGVITLEDVLEEILGKEIVDEFDVVPDMRELARKRREAARKTNLPKNHNVRDAKK